MKPLFILYFTLLPLMALATEDIVDNSLQANKIETTKVRIENIETALVQTQKNLTSLLKQYKKAIDDSLKKQLQTEIDSTRKKIEGLNQSFTTLATGGVQFKDRTLDINKKLDWQNDLMEIVKPLFTAMKDITKKPREIDNLRRLIELYEEQITLNTSAIENINKLAKLNINKKAKKRLLTIKKQRLQAIKDDERLKNVAHFQLDELLNDKESVLETTNEKFKTFITGKGLTLIIAISLFSTILLLGNLVQKSLDNTAQNKHLKFSHRLRRILFRAATIILATFSMLVVFYVRNDWLFMGLAFIFLVGAAFSLKNTLPQYMNEIKMLLDISTVREGERVIYNGIAWKVETLNIQSTLVNPCLRGGTMRMSLKQLADLHSRPYDEKEPWFPCKESDYVVLEAGQGQFGQVVVASPEFVELRAFGGSVITMTTEDFIALNPLNISNKTFCVTSDFGIDYNLQSQCTNEIIDVFKQELQQQILQAPYQQHFVKLKVEFNLANSSSLDYKIIAQFRGDGAQYYRQISRDLQKFAVNVCNNHNWSIPYQQVVVHQASAETS